MKSPYRTLAISAVLHFVVMFALTYVMVASVDHIHLNINRASMAVLMVAPMVVLMLLLMGGMFQDRRRNRIIMAVALLVFAVAFALVRTQTPVGDTQFLRSMIPHHSGAILVCERAALTDPQVVRLCRGIIESQRREIAEMEGLLRRL